MKASVFIAATLDGYIATPDGDIDFLNQHPSTNPDEDFGYHEIGRASCRERV